MKKHTLQTCAAALLLLLLAQTAAGCSSGTTDEGTVTGDTTPATEAVTEDPAVSAKEAYFAALPAISAMRIPLRCSTSSFRTKPMMRRSC